MPPADQPLDLLDHPRLGLGHRGRRGPHVGDQTAGVLARPGHRLGVRAVGEPLLLADAHRDPAGQPRPRAEDHRHHLQRRVVGMAPRHGQVADVEVGLVLGVGLHRDPLPRAGRRHRLRQRLAPARQIREERLQPLAHRLLVDHPGHRDLHASRQGRARGRRRNRPASSPSRLSTSHAADGCADAACRAAPGTPRPSSRPAGRSGSPAPPRPASPPRRSGPPGTRDRAAAPPPSRAPAPSPAPGRRPTRRGSRTCRSSTGSSPCSRPRRRSAASRGSASPR